MPLVQGRFKEDFSGVEYKGCADAMPDLTFPPVEGIDTGIPDLTFPSTDSEAVVQPPVDENKSAGVLPHIHRWFR